MLAKKMPTLQDVKNWRKHKLRCFHEWQFIAESTQSTNDWCGKCGAWRRTSVNAIKGVVHIPEVRK